MTDANERSSTPNYTMGYDEVMRQYLERRTAESNASHLLPHLEPGMRLLDFGCGPGTISVGLARAVEPGEFHGIDMEESQIEIARAAAASGAHDNATFHVGDASAMPFDDEFFDVVHCHTVLNHVPDTQEVLAEANRVLKKGGIFAARDLITSSTFMGPDTGVLGGSRSAFWKRLRANNGHPDMGRELGAVLHAAGFRDVDASASFEIFASDEDVSFMHGLIREVMFSPDAIESDIERGIATREEFDEWIRAVDEWRENPAAIYAFAWGEAIGRKP